MSGVRRHYFLAVLLCVVLIACFVAGAVDAQSAAITIFHINDVYEIDAIDGGRVGGLSRTATVLRRLERTRPAVLMTLGGDYLSPAA